MRLNILFPVLLGLIPAASPAFGQATGTPAAAPAAAAPAPAAEPAAEVKVGTGIEKFDLTGGADTFQVAPGTRLYAWTRVTGITGSDDAPATITLVFAKGDHTVFQMKLDVKHSPYRTNAYRTFRAGDAGAWTAKVLSADGKELGSASFQVTLGAKADTEKPAS